MEYRGKTENGDDIFTVADIGKHSLFLSVQIIPPAGSYTSGVLNNYGLTQDNLTNLAKGCYIGVKDNSGAYDAGVYMLTDAFIALNGVRTIWLRRGSEQSGKVEFCKLAENSSGTWTITRTTKEY